ncbi:MAG TPA: glycosyltransferase family 4 protein, partial [Atribacterota bacterium]|nr:glycosyltransferase family 4 protein [Atribacterota bacterium]
MRILIATNSYPTDKNPTRQVFVKNIYKELQQNAGHVDLVYNQYFRFFYSKLSEGTSFTSIFKVIFLFISYIPFISYKARQYDIIYSHAPVLPGLFMLPAQWIYGVKHVCYVHGSVNEYLEKKGVLFKLARFTLNRCDQVITNSSYMQQKLEIEYGCSSVVISPGYKSEIYNYKAVKKNNDILFAGNAIAIKGIDILLNSTALNREYYKKNNISVKIYCEGDAKKQHINFSQENDLSDIITFGNKLEETELRNQFRSSKIVVVPSRLEALGLVGIEAIACGAFVIATDTGGIEEYIIHGENGYLFEKENHQQLHSYIAKALKIYPDFE